MTRSGWTTVKLAEVIRLALAPQPVDASRSYRNLGIYSFGRGVFPKPSIEGTNTSASTLYQVRAGQFIYSRLFAFEGAYAIVTPTLDGAYVSNEFPTFDCDPQQIETSYLGWLFKRPSVWREIADRSSGMGDRRQRIHPEQVIEHEIPLPPVDEQRRIVARIEELASKVEEARGLRKSCSEEAATILGKQIAEIFTARAHGSWRPGTLGDYVEDDCYGTSEKTNDDVSGTPILRMGNIQDGRLTTHSLKYLHLPQKERDKLILAPGDILVNRTNSAELVGKCAVFDLEGDYGFASYIIRIRLDQTRALPRLVAAYINSPIGRTYMFDERKQMTGQANVNATTLKKLPLPLPNLQVQGHLLAEVDALQAKIDVVKTLQMQTAAELDAMLPSILDKAFKGELT